MPEDNNNISSVPTAVVSGPASIRHTEKEQPASSLLSVPRAQLIRRSSVESAFSGSDISELSFGSTELGSVHDEGLIRTLSNASSTFANIPGPSKWRSRLQDFWISNYGAFLVLLSQMFGCMMNISTRLLETPGSHGAPMHPFQILFVRQLMTVCITFAYAFWSNSVPDFPLGPSGKVRLLLLGRGTFGFLGVFGMYFSLLYLPISEATVLTFLAPIGICYALSILVPGETFSRQQQLAGFISLIGVIFIARPASLFNTSTSNSDVPVVEVSPSGNGTSPAQETNPTQPTSAQHLQAVGVAMIGVCGAIGALTCIRAIGPRAHALISVNYFSAVCTIFSLLALVVVPDVKFRLPGNPLEWFLLLTLGLSGFIMQFLLTVGIAYGSQSASGKDRSADAAADIEMQDHQISLQHSSPSTSAVRDVDAVPVSATHRKAHSTKGVKSSGAKATSMLYTQMLFALIADKVVFGVTPGVWSWIGSGFILCGAVWVAADGSKTVSPSATRSNTALREQGTTHSKSSNVNHEEEVGLLADVDETDADHLGQASNGQTNSRTGKRDVDAS